MSRSEGFHNGFKDHNHGDLPLEYADVVERHLLEAHGVHAEGTEDPAELRHAHRASHAIMRGETGAMHPSKLVPERGYRGE